MLLSSQLYLGLSFNFFFFTRNLSVSRGNWHHFKIILSLKKIKRNVRTFIERKNFRKLITVFILNLVVVTYIRRSQIVSDF